MLEGTEADRRKGIAPSGRRLRALAVQVACGATFARSGFSPQELFDALEINATSGAGRPSGEEIERLLDRPLFVKSDDGLFYLVHQLYREYLTAQGIGALSLTKQCRLLQMQGDGSERVHVRFRGVAAALAEINEQYRSHFLACEPLLACLMELRLLDADEREAMCRTIFDAGIASDRQPWWGIPPRGETPLDVIPRCRPGDISSFLLPYLTNSDVLARQWGAFAAAAWGGDPSLNNSLVCIARDKGLPNLLRSTAVDAIANSQDKSAILGLCDLFEDSVDDVRAAILGAYGKLLSPSPADVFSKLHGGRKDRTMFGSLDGAVHDYCWRLSLDNMPEAFAAAQAQRQQLDDLWQTVLWGLYGRARSLKFYEFPSSFVVDDWEHSEFVSDCGENTACRLACEHPPLLERIWRHVMSLNSGEKYDYGLHRTIECMARGVGTRLLDLLPLLGELSGAQREFIHVLLVQLLLAHPTEETLELVRTRAPAFSGHLFLNAPLKKYVEDDRLDDKRREMAVLYSSNPGAVQQVSSICKNVLKPSRPEARNVLLDELRERAPEMWGKCISCLLDGKRWSYYAESVVQYLSSRKSDLYAEGSIAALSRAGRAKSEAPELLDYAEQFKPIGYGAALKDYYQNLEPGPDELPGEFNGASAFKSLLLLMAQGDPWAWLQFRRRLDEKRVPVSDDDVSLPQGWTFDPAAGRIRALSDWYVLVCQSKDSEKWFRVRKVESFILDAMVASDREGAVGELKRLQIEKLFPDARFLSSRIESLEGGSPPVSWKLADLLGFINREDAAAAPSHASSAELRPILGAAGPAPGAVETTTVTTQPTPNASPVEVTSEAPIFSWLHLSDIHFGHKNISHQWDQTLVLNALRTDIAEHVSRGIPTPNAILVTGDIAFSGTPEQYESAKAWLLDLATRIGISPDRIFLVPGNHDVNRDIDKASRNVARLLRALRDGADDLDETLANPDDKALLTSRMAPYFSFASSFPSLQVPDPLFWSHPMTTPSGLRLRLIGLNTALLAADDLDRGKLRLGKQALARTLTNLPENELTLILSHHPFRDNWLADQRDADSYIKGSPGRIHLSGHVHEADSDESRAGSGISLIRITAGAVHGDKLPAGVPASHGYSFGAIVPGENNSLRLRVWPRRWSEKNKRFTVDIDNIPPYRRYAEHTLPGISFKP